MTSSDLQRLIQLVTEEVLSATGLAGPSVRCACHSMNAECCPDRLRGVLDAGANRIGVYAGGGAARDVAGLIDHTMLKPEASKAEIEQLCREALEHRFATVCVNPTWVAFAASMLRPHGVGVCSVVGFPLGATTPDVKQYETRRAIFDGATEIDMVINVGALKSGDLRTVERDIDAVTDACRPCQRHQQGDHRGGAAHRRREGERVRAVQGGRRGLREDLDGVREGRRHGRRRGPDAPHRRARYGGQGRRRRPRLRGPQGHGGRGRVPRGGQRRRANHS